MIPVLCTSCKHLVKKTQSPIVCKAFPDGIPEDIITGIADHKRPYKGDHGIQYEAL